MNTEGAFKPIIYALLGLLGLVSIITPYVSYNEAYFVGEDYYITMKDSIEVGYEPYIEDLISAERSYLASVEKKKYYTEIKPYSDSLQFALNKASARKDSAKMKSINEAIIKLESRTSETNEKIANQFSLGNMPKAVLAQKIKSIKDTLSMEDYIVVVANQIRNPNNLSTIPSVKSEEIKIKKVNLQDPAGYWIVGLAIIGVVLLMIAMEKELIPIQAAPLRVGGTLIFLIVAIILGFQSYYSLADDIEFKEVFEKRELEVRDRLTQLKDLQAEFLSAKQQYCSSLDSLIYFAKNDSSKIEKYLVDKNDTAAVNNAKRKGLPLKEVVYVPVDVKVFGESHKVQLDSLPFVPYTNKKFSLKTNKAQNANNRDVFYLEIKTKKKTFVDMLEIYPQNFDEDSYIQIGSLAEPTTEGNW